MAVKRIWGVIAALIMLCGCAGSAVSEDVVTGAPESVSAAQTEPEKEPHGAVHDIDPEAEARGADGIPFFFAPHAEETSFVPSEDSVKYNGRHMEHNDICYLSYTGSAVRFMMTGNKIEAVLVSNGSAYSGKQQGWIGVEINGELTQRIRLEDGEKTYLLYEGDMLENAEVGIVKLTENQVANTGIKSITCNASRIVPAPRKSLSIEIIGDSITCGYGNEASGPDKGFDADDQNGAATYGYLTAKKLDADYSLVCISGLGLISNYTDRRGVKENYLLLGRVYDYTDSNFQLRRGIKELTHWDFGSGSDIVVINIGTNDYSYTGRDEDLQDEFYEAYYDFIDDVRKHNPDAEIVCTMGIMGAELFAQIEAAAVNYSEKNGDTHVHAMRFDYQSEADGYGADYHPSVKTHEKAAEQLYEYLKTII